MAQQSAHCSTQSMHAALHCAAGTDAVDPLWRCGEHSVKSLLSVAAAAPTTSTLVEAHAMHSTLTRVALVF